MPPVLIFQLNRFEYNFRYDENIKLKDRFEFYEEIDLREYCDKDDVYELFAVYTHIGFQSYSGHYKVYVRK